MLSSRGIARGVLSRAFCDRARLVSKSDAYLLPPRRVNWKIGKRGGSVVVDQLQTGGKDERITTAVRIPKPLYKRLKHAAIDAEVSVNKLLQQAAERYLAEMPETPS